MAPRERAIEIIEECRAIHEKWARWQEAGGDTPGGDWTDDVKSADVGDPAHHRKWIEKYDLVLAELRGEPE